jgi:hypothetical protein
MADIMSIWSWSLGDFERLQTLDDLFYWHSQAIDRYKKMHGVAS